VRLYFGDDPQQHPIQVPADGVVSEIDETTVELTCSLSKNQIAAGSEAS